MLNFRKFRTLTRMRKLKKMNCCFVWKEMHSSELCRIHAKRWNSINFWINRKQNFKDNQSTNQTNSTFDVDVEIAEIVVKYLWFRKKFQILNHLVWVSNRKNRKMKKMQTLQLSTLFVYKFLAFVVLKSSLMREKKDDLLKN